MYHNLNFPVATLMRCAEGILNFKMAFIKSKENYSSNGTGRVVIRVNLIGQS